MIGTKWPSEKHTFLDPVSGQPVTQLTDQYLNFHLYFTDNSFDPSCEPARTSTFSRTAAIRNRSAVSFFV